MRTLSVDIETYSPVSLKDCGAYIYAAHPDFEVMLFGYAFDDDPVEVIDLAQGQSLPDAVLAALVDPSIFKTAFNANFERVCLDVWLGMEMPPEQWTCSQMLSRELGLPDSLAGVGEALRLPQDEQKDAAGKQLIEYFCAPCKPTQRNGGRTRNLPQHAPDRWADFIEYNRQDVVAERAIRGTLLKYAVPREEYALWALDQRINDRGVRIDPEFAARADQFDDRAKVIQEERFAELTGGIGPKSHAAQKRWIKATCGVDVASLNKDHIEEVRAACQSSLVDEMLNLRAELNKTSTEKYGAMLRMAGADDRARGCFKFYGASTGRWCLTGDHEVLTADGWARLDAWGGGRIACWNPNGELVSFQKANALEFTYAGDMYRYEDSRIQQVSTPDHKMFARLARTKGWAPATVEEMAKVSRPLIPFTGRRATAANVNSEKLRVIVMVQADGHYTNDGDVRLRLRKQRKIERCKTLLRRAGVTYIEQSQADATCFVIKSRHCPLWLRQFRNKTFGAWLFDENPEAFFDELPNWDGYRCGPNSLQYCTCNKMNADMVQAFAHISGLAAAIKTKIRDNEAWNTAYYVDIWLKPTNGHELRAKPTVEAYSGKVYCAETPTGYFLVRRNGKVWVTGNSGRGIQLQNLPKNLMPDSDLDTARQLVRGNDYDTFCLLYSPADTLSQLLRTALIPKPGTRFIVADFSAIEARITAWLAHEKWRMDVFNGNGKIYEASAEQMFHLPPGSVKKGDPMRARGKVAELALGFGAGPGGLIRMGALREGLGEDELQPIVDSWRAASPNIVKLWHDAEDAAKEAIAEKRSQTFAQGAAAYYMDGPLLRLRLPSGRAICYARPRVVRGQIQYETQCGKSWITSSAWHGTLTENLVQATARDCLAAAMLALDAAGLEIVAHVHDECIIEAPPSVTVNEVCEIMGQSLPWAPGLPLRADGYECDYYMKR
ncbi:MAG: hypothetical protein LBJ11_09005 [Oscillospiraceae bacterium]|jgi:hypothetical protein|nr:hypothetical protein [Oscillospiraceae bacterium]